MSVAILKLSSLDDDNLLRHPVPTSATVLDLSQRRLLSLPTNLAALTRLEYLALHSNSLYQLPEGLFTLTSLQVLTLFKNRFAVLPPALGLLTNLTTLSINDNASLSHLPHELGRLHSLRLLCADNCVLVDVPPSLGHLPLSLLALERNWLTWLPVELDLLPLDCELRLDWNPLALDGLIHRSRLPELFAVTTKIAMLRERAFVMCVGLQELELPALVTLEILDAAWDNDVPMHLKWDLVVKVKHFHK